MQRMTTSFFSNLFLLLLDGLSIKFLGHVSVFYNWLFPINDQEVIIYYWLLLILKAFVSSRGVFKSIIYLFTPNRSSTILIEFPWNKYPLRIK